MVFFFIPIELIFAVFLLGAGTTDITYSWLQTIEAHYLMIMFIVITISFAIVFSTLIYGEMSGIHKVLLFITFIVLSIAVIGNYCIWSTKTEQVHTVQSLTSILYATGKVTDGTSQVVKNETITSLFNSVRISLGYLCFCMVVIPIIGTIIQKITGNKIISFITKLSSTILISSFMVYGFYILNGMLKNYKYFIA